MRLGARDLRRGPLTQPVPNLGRVSGPSHTADETLIVDTIFTNTRRRAFNAIHLGTRRGTKSPDATSVQQLKPSRRLPRRSSIIQT